MTETATPPTPRVRVKRMGERGAYDRATIDAILDATPLAHIGYVHNGQPFVTPTLHWREGDRVYFHGSAASRMIETTKGLDICLTVTLMDGFVLARSAFHHSINYRSVMLLGRAEMLTDPEEKALRLKNFVDGLFPGRWDMLRPVLPKEMKATSVMSLAIDEASAKIRSGGPGDDDEDYALDIWAGVLPVKLTTAAPIDDPLGKQGLSPPSHVTDFKFG